MSVVSATSSQVQLKWTPGDNTATGYVVERKTLNGSYSTALNATGATASDNNLDAYTTYVYRVRATSTSGQSGPSNEVTVGPPPYGFNLAAAPPSNVTRFYQFGIGLRMALDSNGDPALAYIFQDPNEDSEFSDSAVYFVKWNRAAYQWTTPLRVALTEEVDTGSTHALSIARDPSNGTWGIAFEDRIDRRDKRRRGQEDRRETAGDAAKVVGGQFQADEHHEQEDQQGDRNVQDRFQHVQLRL